MQDFLTLSAFTGSIKQALTNSFAGQLFWVSAEVSNLSYYKNKRTWYFDLCEKDATSSKVVALVRSVAYGQVADDIEDFQSLTGQLFQNGIQVLVQLEVLYHEVYGLQARMRKLDAYYTLGNIERQRRLTLTRLVQENPLHVQLHNDVYSTRNKLLVHPAVFQRLAIISSLNSAGLGDFIHTLKNNRFGYTFATDLYDTEVQGTNNAAKMVDILVEIFKVGVKYDAIAILRGGGSQSDFVLFDTYEIARAVARYPVPIVTGIGHQKNETIVDLMAAVSTKTPTKAAEFFISANRMYEESLLGLQQQILAGTRRLVASRSAQVGTIVKLFTRNSAQKLEIEKNTLERLKLTLSGKVLGHIHLKKREIAHEQGHLITVVQGFRKLTAKTLKEVSINQVSVTRRFLRRQGELIVQVSQLFDAFDISKTLARGFAVLKKDGMIMSSIQQLNYGEAITAELKDGSIEAIVGQISIKNNERKR